MNGTYDLAIVGGGIVGLATARAARAARPDSRVIVLEKEGSPAGHQTGRNSGVIHAGVYYKPGSEKARLCRAGRLSIVEFCQQHDVAHEICGKTVVAVSADELTRLAELESRCRANGLSVVRIGPEQLREREPHATGVAALYVPETGIADYPGVCRALVAEHEAKGGELRLHTEVRRGHDRPGAIALETTTGDIVAGHVVTCAGLHADRVARAVSGPDGAGDLRIIPFRGEYFELAPSKSHLVKALIYPVPDPQFPFLGVHLTRGVNGRVHAGPNAVLALAREGYSWRHRSWRDMQEILAFSGFRHLAARHWRYGLAEMARSLSRRRFARALQRLVPEVTEGDLEPAPAGVRAQAVAADGSLVDDFAFRSVGRALHVLNAPSPAATASLEIGRLIVARLGPDWAP